MTVVRAVEVPEKLQWLLRSARGRTPQRKAATAAGISASWWKQIESGSRTSVPEATLLRMCDAVAILPRHLRSCGLEDLADALEERHRALGAECPFTDELEQYLWRVPEGPAMRDALISYSRELRKVRTPPAEDPFVAGVVQTSRRRPSPLETRRARQAARDTLPGAATSQ